MMNSIEILCATCNRIGQKVPHWTQGPGGNISYKSDGLMSIKASGARLDSVTVDSGIAVMRYKEFLDDIFGSSYNSETSEKKYSDAISRCAISGPARPSMEAGMHALLAAPWVAHFHSLVALLVSHESIRAGEQFKKWLKQNSFGDMVFLPFEIPGLELSLALREKKRASIYVLKNHGVALQSDGPMVDELGNPAGELSRWIEFERRFLREFRYSFPTRSVSTPIRCYFPDTAVFLARVLNVCVKDESDRWLLKGDAMAVDRDAAEIWQATQFLFAMCPELEEIDTQTAARIASLPTEEYRKRLNG